MEEGRPTSWNGPPLQMTKDGNIWTAWTRAEKMYKKVQENNHESRLKTSLKTSSIFINHNRKQIKSIL